eukprot:TRINITY_DN1085_c0_g1_i9.p1 TRINITY_DN1085_c0_g1~~TRINITY_DN1085_c0_g1_i9.p1  ORF type:complete len:318 (+),score=-0.18 TRINITY_DN1085_c0_g1_i9:135-1088(+)
MEVVLQFFIVVQQKQLMSNWIESKFYFGQSLNVLQIFWPGRHFEVSAVRRNVVSFTVYDDIMHQFVVNKLVIISYLIFGVVFIHTQKLRHYTNIIKSITSLKLLFSINADWFGLYFCAFCILGNFDLLIYQKYLQSHYIISYEFSTAEKNMRFGTRIVKAVSISSILQCIHIIRLNIIFLCSENFFCFFSDQQISLKTNIKTPKKKQQKSNLVTQKSKIKNNFSISFLKFCFEEIIQIILIKTQKNKKNKNNKKRRFEEGGVCVTQGALHLDWVVVLFVGVRWNARYSCGQMFGYFKREYDRTIFLVMLFLQFDIQA